MISSIVVTVTSTSPRTLGVAFNTTLVKGPGDVNSVGVNFGASSTYGQTASGQPTSTNADGSVACVASINTDLAPVHFQCVVTDFNNATDTSADQVYGAAAGGGGDDDDDHERGHGEHDDHGGHGDKDRDKDKDHDGGRGGREKEGHR